MQESGRSALYQSFDKFRHSFFCGKLVHKSAPSQSCEPLPAAISECPSENNTQNFIRKNMKNRIENFYVITGGPGVGKTTLIKALNSKGFKTVEEDARKIIKNQIETSQEGLPWKNQELYAKLMFEASLKSYEKMAVNNHSKPIFFDRGILDSICYMKMEKIQISEKTNEIVKQCPYNKNIFILPPWKEIYETDNERKQNWDEAKFTFKKMKETYMEFNYNIIIVPKMRIEERVEFILQNIEK